MSAQKVSDEQIMLSPTNNEPVAVQETDGNMEETVEINIENIQEVDIKQHNKKPAADLDEPKTNSAENETAITIIEEDVTTSNADEINKVHHITNVVEQSDFKKKYNFAKSRAKQECPKNMYPFQYKRFRKQQLHPLPYGQDISVYFNMPIHPTVGDPIDYEDGSSDRNLFVRKVFTITGVMLLVTVIFVFIVLTVAPVNRFMRTLLALILFIVCSIGHMVVGYIFCLSAMSSTFPCNYILCVVETICMTFVVGFISARYFPFVVLGTAVVTLAITLVCLGLAYTSFDFTRLLLVVMVAMIALALGTVIVFILTFALGIKLTIVRIILLVLMAVVLSVMMIIEFQMILGGKAVELGEDDYCYGAFAIYSAIVSLFITLLRLIGLITD